MGGVSHYDHKREIDKRDAEIERLRGGLQLATRESLEARADNTRLREARTVARKDGARRYCRECYRQLDRARWYRRKSAALEGKQE